MYDTRYQQTQPVYKPKIIPVVEQEEEKKGSDSGAVTLHYDPQWLSILKATQELLPLEAKNYDFRSLTKDDAQLMKAIEKARLELLP